MHFSLEKYKDKKYTYTFKTIKQFVISHKLLIEIIFLKLPKKKKNCPVIGEGYLYISQYIMMG
jgi:hypothetical protein